MKNIVLIIAGGSGTRMGIEVPKQYLEFRGKPIISYSLIPLTVIRLSIALSSSQMGSGGGRLINGSINLKYISLPAMPTRLKRGSILLSADLTKSKGSAGQIRL